MAVGAGGDSGVEDDDDSFIAGGADEAADALSEFEDGFREGVIAEGVSAIFEDSLQACGDEGLIWDGEGEACDHDITEGGAADIDAHPEAVEAEEDVAVVVAEEADHVTRGEVLILDEEVEAVLMERGTEFVGEAAHLEGVGEEDESAAAGTVGPEADTVEECVMVGGFIFWVRGEWGGEEEAHLAGVVKGGTEAELLGGADAEAVLEVGEVAVDGEGGAGEDDGREVSEEGFGEDGCDID